MNDDTQPTKPIGTPEPAGQASADQAPTEQLPTEQLPNATAPLPTGTPFQPATATAPASAPAPQPPTPPSPYADAYATPPPPADHPRIRWGGVVWGALFCAFGVVVVFVLSSDSNRNGFTSWIDSLGPAGSGIVALVALGALVLILGIVGAANRAQRGR